MSLDDLRKDLKRLGDPGACPALAALDVNTRGYLKNEFLPLFDSVFDLLEEHEGTMDELTEQSEDFLHAETAQEIGKPITIGFALADELEKRLPQTPDANALRAMITEYRAAAQTALVTLRDIAIPDGDEDDEEEEEGDDEGEGDEEGAQ